MPLISIIIPVYNTEKFIGECIESILRQTFTDFEVILINDGSTDRSILIVEKIIGNDPRFIILHQENKGQSAARNLGLQKAQGKYIQFIDSDDYILPTMLEDKCALSEEMDLDMCISTLNRVTTSGKFMQTVSYPNLKKSMLNTRKNVLRNCGLENPVVCTILFNKHIFSGESFVEGKYFEDWELMHKLIYRARSCYYTDVAYYQYRQNPVSTTHNVSRRKMDDLIYAFATIKNYKNGLVMRDKSLRDVFIRRYSGTAITGLVAQAIFRSSSIKEYIAFSKYSVGILDKEIINLKTLLSMRSLSFYQKIQILLLLKSPGLSYIMYKLVNKFINRYHRRFQ